MSEVPPPVSVTARIGAHGFRNLEPGKRYQVIEAFVDFDGTTHPVGETWIYLTQNFLPYDDGLSLFVSRDGTAEWQIRMRWLDEDQGPIVDHLERYIALAPEA